MMLRLSPRQARALARATGRHGPTLTALSKAALERFSGRTALVIGGEAWSFDRLWAASESLAAHWYRSTLGGERRTIVAASDGVALPLSVLAAGRLGLDVWLANPARLAELHGVVPADAVLVHDGQAPTWHTGPTFGTEELRRAVASRAGSLGFTRHIGRIVLMTAGTSGAPHPHLVRPFSVRGLRQLRGLHARVGIADTDTVLCCSPLYDGHGLQLFAATLLTGATLVSAAADEDAASRLALARSRGATILTGKPAQLEALVDELGRGAGPAPSLRRIVSGSEPLPAALVSQLHDQWGPIVMNAYGTAATGTITIATPAELQADPGTVGTALPGTEIGIVGHPHGEEATGRVWVRGASRTVITDDRGRIHDGRLTILGRLDGAQRPTD